MKKRLGFVLLLALVGMSGAALQIAVEGDFDPQDFEYVLHPSETLTLALWTDSEISLDGSYFALGVLNSQGTISGGFPPGWIIIQIYPPEQMPFPIEGMNGIVGWAMPWEPQIIAPGSIVCENITFHCAGAEDAVIQLWEINALDWTIGSLMDQVIIDQVPEPMTLLLLGLGGLFIRRK